MLLLFWTDLIYESIGFQYVFLAQQFVDFHVRRVGPDQLPGDAFAVFFIRATLHRLHLLKLTALVMLRFSGLRHGSKQQDGNDELKTHRLIPRVDLSYRGYFPRSTADCGRFPRYHGLA